MNKQIKNLIGQKFGKLTVTRFNKSLKKIVYWDCLCECGKETTIRKTNLLSGNTTSCGCQKAIQSAIRSRKLLTTHNLSFHRLYNVWVNMIRRCTNIKNKSYSNYGGRGITVCDHWLDIKNFIRDMESSYKEGLSLDRIDNDGGYSKDNCRWATLEVQMNNMRNNVKFNGESCYQASRRLGGSHGLVHSRLKKGVPIESAFVLPINYSKNIWR